MEPLEDRRLLSGVPRPHSEFGYAVAADGDLRVVGAPYSDIAGEANVGLVHVFGSTSDEPLLRIHNPTRAPYDIFGYSVAVSASENKIVVGTPGADYADWTDVGAAYVFNATTGERISTLVNPTEEDDDQFGWFVAISGDTVVVGTPGAEENAGGAYVFNADTGEHISTLRNPTPADDDYFGRSVAISGNTVVVGTTGADYSDTTNAGAAYVFDVSEPGAPVLEHTLVNPTPANNDYFGYSLAISGNTLVVGTPYANYTHTTNAGAAYVFDATTGQRTKTLVNPTPVEHDYFGWSVAISANTVVVGTSHADYSATTDAGEAYVFNATTGDRISRLVRLKPQDPSERTPQPGANFGFSVAISGDTVLIGARHEYDGGAEEAGAAYVFDVSTPADPVLDYRLRNPLESVTDDMRYMIYDDWGGVWHDAEKRGHDDWGMCWAAAASNILTWTGWGTLPGGGLTDTDNIFERFQYYWTDDARNSRVAWDWWFDGEGGYDGNQGYDTWSDEHSYVDVLGGGAFFPGLDYRDYYRHYGADPPENAVARIKEYLQDGYGVTLGIKQPGSTIGHAITCWGYGFDGPDPDNILGIHVTDSDDDMFDPWPDDYLQYYYVEQRGDNKWYLLGDFAGWYIKAVYGLKRFDRDLEIKGTEHDDQFRINAASPGQVVVWKYDSVAGEYTFYAGASLDRLDCISVDGLGGNDTLEVNFVAGNPIPDGGLAFDGGSDDSDSLTISGSFFSPSPFGDAVAADGDLTVVGAPYADIGGVADAGAAYVFDSTTGELLATLENPTPAEGDHFGSSVAISGSTVVVGTPDADYSGKTDAGAAYVFDVTSGGDYTNGLVRPTPEDYAQFGYSVAISGSTVVVGAPYEDDPGADEEDSGAAYVFDVSVPGNPAAEHTLANRTPAEGDHFGSSVAISGNTVVVGTPDADYSGTTDAGAAYVFDVTSGADYINGLVRPTPEDYAQFGYSVAISGSTVVVGAVGDNTGADDSGAAYVFDVSVPGNPAPEHTLENRTPAEGDHFGSSVAISGSTVVVGTPDADYSGKTDAGAAYVFDVTSGADYINGLVRPTPEDYAQFGYSVAISGSTVVVGAPHEDDRLAEDAGAAYLFDVSTPGNPEPEHRLQNPTPPTCVYAADTIVHTLTDAGSGQIDVDGSIITYCELEGDLEPMLDGVSAVNRVFDFGPAGDNVTLGDDGVPDNGVSRISIPGGQTLDFSNPSNSLTLRTGDLLTIDGTFQDFDNTLVVDVAGSAEMTGAIGGALGLTKTGPGTLTLSGVNSFAGATNVSEGRLDVNGSIDPASTVTVASGATLGGTGTVAGEVNVQGGGTVAPGLSPGILSTGDLNLADDSTFDVEIGGSTPGQHDQLVITGSVTIGNNVTLSLSDWGGFVPSPGDEFLLIDNDQADAVTGTFSGLAEGAIVSADFFPIGQTARITYVGGDGNDVAIEFIPATVTARLVFYNNSAFDGGDPGANQQDDSAIAFDKQALLPGQTATFANYTSFSSGINGIMVDVADLPDGVTPTAEDFELKVGNSDDAAGWADAPPPTSVTLWPGAGVDGSDRITLVWPDNVIQKQWLQVTIPAGGNLGLDEPDVFYFGNAIGESGNSTTDAKVNAYDMLGARDNQRTFVNPAAVDFNYDYNRDARVNAYDMLIARDNQTHFLNALKLITVPPSKVTTAMAETEGRSARDAVFERAVAAESGRGDNSFGRLDWLYELEPTGAHKHPTRAQSPAEGTVDLQIRHFLS